MHTGGYRGVVNFPMSFLIIEVPSDIFSAVCERLLERWSNHVPTVRKAINPPLSSQMCDLQTHSRYRNLYRLFGDSFCK